MPPRTQYTKQKKVIKRVHFKKDRDQFKQCRVKPDNRSLAQKTLYVLFRGVCVVLESVARTVDNFYGKTFAPHRIKPSRTPRVMGGKK